MAISYYAVNLVTYVLGPLAEGMQMSKTVLTALVAVPVVAGVWFAVHRIRKSME